MDGRTAPILSVVVPFYDVEPYLEACLRSIQRQSLASIEVILVDDGSTDASRSIAEHFVEQDRRFRLVTQENRGTGPARNNGAAAATGQFITFVDSDDLVSPFGFERSTASLSRTGSSVATGSALRFDLETGFRPSWLHRSLHVRELSGARIDEHPELARDRMIWNKVFRRDFWTAGTYEFPSGSCQDFPVSAVTLLDATTIDVITAPVYFWRERETGDSVSQRSGEFSKIIERVQSDEFVIDLLGRRLPEALAGVRAIFAETDLRAVSQAFESVDDPSELLPLARRLLALIGDEACAARPRIERLQHRAIEMGQVEFLVDIARLLSDGGRIPTKHVRRRSVLRRHFVDDIASPTVELLPFELRRIPAAEQLPMPVLHSARLVGRSMELRGAIDVSQIDEAEHRISLRLSRGQWSTALETTAVRPNPAFGGSRLGFSTHLPVDLLDSSSDHPGALKIEAEVVGRNGAARAPVRAAWPGSGQFGPGCLLPSGAWAQLSNVADGVGVNWRRSPTFLDTVSVESGRLHLTVTSDDPDGVGRSRRDDLELLIRRPSDAAPIVVAQTGAENGRGVFTVPLDLLDEGAIETLALPYSPGWSVWLRRSGRSVPVLWPVDADAIPVSTARRDLLFTRTATNSLQVCDLPTVPVVTSVTLDDHRDQRLLTVCGTSSHDGAPTHWRTIDGAGDATEVACHIIDDDGGGGGDWRVSSAVEDLRRAADKGLTDWRLIRRVPGRHELAWVAPSARAAIPLGLAWDGAGVVVDPHNGTLRLRWWQE